jgi:hypothetical protein
MSFINKAYTYFKANPIVIILIIISFILFIVPVGTILIAITIYVISKSVETKRFYLIGKKPSEYIALAKNNSHVCFILAVNQALSLYEGSDDFIGKIKQLHEENTYINDFIISLDNVVANLNKYNKDSKNSINSLTSELLNNLRVLIDKTDKISTENKKLIKIHKIRNLGFFVQSYGSALVYINLLRSLAGLKEEHQLTAGPIKDYNNENIYVIHTQNHFSVFYNGNHYSNDMYVIDVPDINVLAIKWYYIINKIDSED